MCVKKGGNLVCAPAHPTPRNGLIYGFQMVTGMFIWTLPKLPEPLGSAKIRLQISREQNFFSGVGGVGRWWLRFPVLPVSELLEMRQKLYFRISVPGRSWKLRLQMCTKKGMWAHACIHSHTGKLFERGIVCPHVASISNRHTIFSISKKKKMRVVFQSLS